MKKVVILGCPGSGKSHLARLLHRKTGLPLHYLDRIWWREDMSHVTRSEFDAKLGEILQTEAWIIDGDYSRTYEPRIRACDTILFLDYDEAQCLEGISQRIGKRRADCPFAEDGLDPVLLDEVRRYRAEKRPNVLELLGRYSEKEIHVFHCREDADVWLDSVASINEEIEFKKFSDFPRGTMYDILCDAYAFDSRNRELWDDNWRESDRFFYDNPAIADKYGLVTCLDGEPIGFVTWDPRHKPDYVEIGHNGVREKYKRRGFGHAQLAEAVRRIRQYEGLKRIIVCTNERLAAPRNYESVGFVLYDRKMNETDSAYLGDYLYYELPMLPVASRN